MFSFFLPHKLEIFAIIIKIIIHVTTDVRCQNGEQVMSTMSLGPKDVLAGH